MFDQPYRTSELEVFDGNRTADGVIEVADLYLGVCTDRRDEELRVGDDGLVPMVVFDRCPWCNRPNDPRPKIVEH